MIWFYLWVPLIIVLHIIGAKLSIMNQNGSNKAGLLMWFIGMLPIWVFISRYSKNILFDALLYDMTLVIVYAIGIAYFGDKVLSPINYVGMVLAFIGLFMVKI